MSRKAQGITLITLIVTVVALVVGNLVTPTPAHADPGVFTPVGSPLPTVSSWAQLQGAAPDSPADPSATDVPLITGDVVHLNATGDVAGVTPGQRPDGSITQYSVVTSDAQTYVIPVDVSSLVGDQLDPELFNVTKLASYDLSADSSIPVIVTHPATVETATVTKQMSTMGVSITTSLDPMPIQAGEADASSTDGPAPTWTLIDHLDQEATSPADPVSSQTKVWLDQKIQLSPMTVTPLAATDTPAWMATIGADVAKSEGFDGTGIKVAVIDSGMDANHPDLAGQIIASKDFTGSGSTGDPVGHGTFVASEIAGTGKASNGQYAGVAPGAKLINARVIDRTGGGYDSDMMSGLQWAAQQGANIVNMSLGDYTTMDDGTSVLSQFVNQIARQYGFLIVVAAGNEGAPQTVSTPATADEALSVGATLQDGTLAWFSSTGPRRGDGAVNPQIMAPGAGTVTLDRNGNPVRDRYGDPQTSGLVAAGSGTTGYISDGYFGTSMAAPLVAGAAALVAQAHPSLNRTGIKASLMAGASPLPDGSDPFQQGAGLLNIPAAIHAPVTTSPSQLNYGTVTSSLPAQTTRTLTYTNTSSQAETFTLSSSLSFTTSRGAPTSGYSASSSTATVSGSAGTSTTTVSVDVPATSDQVLLSTPTITIPASGSASITVTINPAAFSAGYVGGYVTATSPDVTLRTPLGWANQTQKYTLTITANDKDGGLGDPAKGDVTLVNMDTGATQVVSPVSSRMTMSVIGGRYVAVASLTQANNLDGTDATLVESPVLTISSNTSVNLDGRGAKLADIQTDLPTTDAQPTLVLSATSPSLSYKYARFVTSDRGVLSTDRVYVTPVADSSWQLSSLAWLAGPTVEASDQGCGASTVPVVSVGAPLPAGQYAWTETSASSLPLPVANGKAAVLARWGTGLTAATASAWADAARSSGYAALIVVTDSATATRSALTDALGAQPSLPVLVTTAASQAAAADTSATITVLSRTQPDYYYLLAKDFPVAQSQSFTLSGTAATTASVTVQHRAMTTNPSWTDVFTYRPAAGNGVITGGGFTLANVSSSYVAHVSADPMWTAASVSAGMTDRTAAQAVVPERLYRTGEASTISFGTQVHSAALSPTAPLVRTGDSISAGIPGYVDGQGLFDTGRQAYPATFGTSTLTLTDQTTSTAIPLTLDAPTQTVTANVPSASHSYSLDQTALVSPTYWALSGSVTTQWTWQSQTSSGATTEALRQVWYELVGLDADNAGSPQQAIVVHVGQQSGSAAQPVTQVSLQASTNGGAAWTDVPLQLATTPPPGSVGARSGETLYTGTIPATNGDLVSLKSSVQGGTSGFAQTVTNAYTVTASPQGFAQPVVWSCQTKAPGMVLTANATQITGTSSPSTTVWVLDSAGNTLGQTTTDENGQWSINTPAGVVSQTISLATLDDQGTATILATAELDTGIPDPARVDQANSSAVSGGVGAVQPADVVTVVFPSGASGSDTAGTDGAFSVATPAGEPSGQMTVTVASPAGNQSQPVSYWVNFTSVADLTVDTANATQISGTGRPGTTVVVTDAQGGQLGSTQVGADGRWTVTVPPGTPSQPITATVGDQFGNSASVQAMLAADTPAAPTVSTANAAAVSGTADPGSTVRVTFPDQSALETTAGPDGTYSVATPAGMPSGEIAVSALNSSGNASAAVTANLDTQPPAAPRVDEADSLQIVGTAGAAEAGSTITVVLPDGQILTTTPAADGSYLVTVPTAGMTGQITVTATDAAGNVSAPTTISLSELPDPPVVTSANASAVTGTATPGARVSVTDESGAVLGTTTVAPNGSWSVPVPAGTASQPVTVDIVTDTGLVLASTVASLDTDIPQSVVIVTANGQVIAGTAEPGVQVTVLYPDRTDVQVIAGPDGTFSLATPAGMPSGTIVVTAADSAGNLSQPVTLQLDTQAPPAARVDRANATEVSGGPGAAEAGAVVAVTFPDGSVVSTQPQANGSYTVTTPAGTASGQATLTVTDNAGNVSMPTTVDLDTLAPAAPRVDRADLTVVAGDAGAAEPGSTLTAVFPNGTTRATATAAADGSYAIATPAGVLAGTISVTATDPAGNESASTGADLVAGSAALSVTRANATDIAGTAAAGKTVRVTDGQGQVLGTAVVATDGTWSIPTPEGTASGPITIAVTDTTGTVLDSTSVDLDTQEPAPVVITSANASHVTGHAEPGSTVMVTFPGSTGGTPVQVDASGLFSVATPVGTPSGSLSASAVDAAGNESMSTTAYLDTEAPDPARVDQANATRVSGNVGAVEANATVAVTFPDGATASASANPDGSYVVVTPAGMVSGEISVTVTDTAGNVSTAVTAILDSVAPQAPEVDTTDGSLVSGWAEPGSVITVTNADSNPIAGCTAVLAGADGFFSCVPSPALTTSAPAIVTATDQAGNSSLVVTVPVVAAGAIPATPVIVTANATTIAGTAPAGTTVVVGYMTAHGPSVTPAQADAAGNWTVTTPDDAIDGPITAAAIDADQQASQFAQAALDTTAPDAPVIQVADDVQISGTAEANSWVQVSYADGTPLAQTTADTNGVWLIPTPDNAHSGTISAVATDAAGNPSQATTVPLAIPAPGAPTITSPADGAVLTSGDVTLAGTGIPGATVTVVGSDGTTVCTAVVDTNRTWTCSGTLVDATQALTATQVVTGAGQSPQSTAVVVTVTTQPTQSPTTPAPSGTASSNPATTSTSTATGTVTTAPAAPTTPATTPTAPTTPPVTTPAAPSTTAAAPTTAPAAPTTAPAAPTTIPAAPSTTPAVVPSTPAAASTATPPAAPTTPAPAAPTTPAVTPTGKQSAGPSSPATTPSSQPGSPTTTPATGPGAGTTPTVGAATTSAPPAVSPTDPTASTAGPDSASTAAAPGTQAGTPGTSPASGSGTTHIPTGGTTYSWLTVWPIAIFLLAACLLVPAGISRSIKRHRVHTTTRTNS